MAKKEEKAWSTHFFGLIPVIPENLTSGTRSTTSTSLFEIITYITLYRKKMSFDMIFLGTTNVIRENAFNPCWDETFNFNLIYRPSLALLRISVYHQNPTTARNPGSQKKLGQATIPVEYLRPGIR